jgi:hypothetical protein
MRIIPKTAKVKVEFFKNISLADILIALFFLALEVLLFLTNLGTTRFYIMIVVLCIGGWLYVPFDGQRFYMAFVNGVKFLFSVKRYSLKFDDSASDIKTLMPFKVIQDGFIVYQDYYAGVLQIDPREFRLLTGYRQDQIIDLYFGKLIRSISGHSKASLVKIDRNINLEEFILSEERKKDELKKIFDAGDMTENELFARERIIDDRINLYKNLNTTNKISKPYYYLVVYDKDQNAIKEILKGGEKSLFDAGMSSKILNNRELAVFLKYNYTNNFEENDVKVLHDSELYKWVIPHNINFTSTTTSFDGVETLNFTIRNYPLNVLNAWGYKLFNIDNTKVVMNLQPYEKNKAVRMIDRSLQELISQSDYAYKASSIIDKQTHIDTLVNLLRLLQNDNETLFSVNIHITVYKREFEDIRSVRKKIRSILSEQGFDVVENFSRQNKAVISSNLSMYDAIIDTQRAIHSSSVAAVFPFVLSNIMEDKGSIIGQSQGYPVIVDFFKRNKERVNSNMVIMGKSGSGKSYATKTILSHLSAENCKIFILDPEDEYSTLAKNVGGKVIDVGTAIQGRINPFHVITTLESDEEGIVNDFSVHLQFLEQFFHEILPGIDPQALEYLNNLIVDLYASKKINSSTDFSKLKAKDYPIFDDLYDLINTRLSKAKVDYDVNNLRILLNFVSKFAHEGRDSNLWNGESKLTVKENFTVFNFRSLLANKNGVISNAQMLLVLKWLDNEIIKNRDFNIKHNTNRKIIIAIDEAHVFIDPKFPVALDFMYQLAKRIRKYNGMQIVITQNIKDFVGSQEIIRKSSAIINACQYSFIFSLAPNDMDDLCTLYDKAGRINETEQDQIVNNDRGNAFIITSSTSRANIEIVASNKVSTMFEGDNTNKDS